MIHHKSARTSTPINDYTLRVQGVTFVHPARACTWLYPAPPTRHQTDVVILVSSLLSHEAFAAVLYPGLFPWYRTWLLFCHGQFQMGAGLYLLQVLVPDQMVGGAGVGWEGEGYGFPDARQVDSRSSPISEP